MGRHTNDPPAVLTLLADHYQPANATWTRLKGLMVYPVIILVLSTALSLWIALLLGHFPGSPGPDKPSITSLFGLSTIVSAGPAKPARPRTASSPRNQTATPEPVAHWNPSATELYLWPPPMFVWLVAGAGEDLATGFQRAAQTYQGRAAYRTELLLYASLPASLFLLGLMILSQIYPVTQLIFGLPKSLSF